MKIKYKICKKRNNWLPKDSWGAACLGYDPHTIERNKFKNKVKDV